MTASPLQEPGSAPESAQGAVRSGGRPLFTYRYQHGVDGQGRIQFPSRWKLRASDSELVAVVVTHRLLKKDYVLVLPYDLFESFTERLRTAAFTDMTAQASRHEYAERMMTIDLDGAGRFSLPQEIRKPASLEKEALLVGCVDRFEIWNPADYEAARERERMFLDGVKPTERIEL